MKPQNENSKLKSRKDFLKIALSAGAVMALFSSVSPSKEKNTEKIKLLTPDGKLVEIEKSAIEKEIISTRATDQQVLEWMSSKKESR